MRWNLSNKAEPKFVSLFYCVLVIIHVSIPLATCDVFKLGYLTGSARRPGDQEYERPGELIKSCKQWDLTSN